MSDLAREIAELLPCEAYCDGNDTSGRCIPCVARPAILTWAERKLAEANELRRGAEYDAGCLRADLDAAHADSELLAKVEALLRCNEGRLIWYSLTRQTYNVGSHVDAPTLREALRKLVGGES